MKRLLELYLIFSSDFVDSCGLKSAAECFYHSVDPTVGLTTPPENRLNIRTFLVWKDSAVREEGNRRPFSRSYLKALPVHGNSSGYTTKNSISRSS